MNGPAFAIDPGSKKTGWAVLTEREQLVSAGLLTGDKTTDSAELRIRAMCRGLVFLLDEWQPGTVLIEWSSGHVGRRRHQGGGAGLAVYGIAIGALWQTAESWATTGEAESGGPRARVCCIAENLWTNRVPKADRLTAVAQQFPAYRVEDDPGGDVGDAIALGVWWCKEQQLVPF